MAGQCHNIRSLKGHRFLFRGEKTGNELGRVVVGPNLVFRPTVPVPEEEKEYQGSSSLHSLYLFCAFPPEGFPEDLAEHEFLEIKRAQCDERRLMLNIDQPSWVPHFTPVGFLKTIAPSALYAEILNFYKHNLNKEIPEGRSLSDCYHENVKGGRTTMIHVSDVLRA